MQLTQNFDSTELATSSGELNIDIAYILTLQAWRSWLGVPLYFGKGCGCRYPKWQRTYEEGCWHWSKSAHNIYMPMSGEETNPNANDDNLWQTIPATASDPHAKKYDSWGLMAKLEEFMEITNERLFISDSNANDLLTIDNPIFTGRGVYPDTNSQCIHIDMGHRSLNPAIRDKRQEVKRWVRVKGVYHYARQGEGFKELRERLGL